jgi:hypothetical protein
MTTNMLKSSPMLQIREETNQFGHCRLIEGVLRWFGRSQRGVSPGGLRTAKQNSFEFVGSKGSKGPEGESTCGGRHLLELAGSFQPRKVKSSGLYKSGITPW